MGQPEDQSPQGKTSTEERVRMDSEASSETPALPEFMSHLKETMNDLGLHFASSPFFMNKKKFVIKIQDVRCEYCGEIMFNGCVLNIDELINACGNHIRKDHRSDERFTAPTL
jgi:hypothetical protein